ncbi:hypothetical protein ABEB36_009537 [Hypothenemus hampei]|uniref:Uncharacterized protein n=1 Tax=Hypothenemus hampei TaxID=57062 RepID=A0ABD1EGN6_HYPHA
MATPISATSEKSLINSKLETVRGLNDKFNLTKSDAAYISKQLDKFIEIFNVNGKVNFKVKEKVNVAEKIQPQVRMFSTKNKRNLNSSEDIVYALPYEAKIIKLALSKDITEVVNIQTGFDHNYAKTHR